MEPKKQRIKKIAKPTQVDWRTDTPEGNKVENLVHIDNEKPIENMSIDELIKAGDETIINLHKFMPKLKKQPLKSLQELVPEQEGTWEWAENRAVQFKEPIRRKSWPEGDMVFYREAGFKQMKEGMENRGFYAPLTPEFMKSIGVTKFTISSHWNRFRKGVEATGQKCSYLQVGYIVSKAEKEASDWEIITSK